MCVEDFMLSSSSSSEDESQGVEEPEMETDEQTNVLSNIQEPVKPRPKGNFLLIKILYDKNTKKEKEKNFICQVIGFNKEADQKVITCKFLRNYKGSNDTYVFPVIDDIDGVSFDQIVSVLTLSSCHRGRYQFADTH